jgi:phosphoglycerol transferase MdoB-like AlkP superfamily enzyme
MYPSLPVYGLLLQLIGVILMWDLVLSLFRKNKQALLGMLLVLAVFGFFYFLGPKDEWSRDKFTTMITHGLTMVSVTMLSAVQRDWMSRVYQEYFLWRHCACTPSVSVFTS